MHSYTFIIEGKSFSEIFNEYCIHTWIIMSVFRDNCVIFRNQGKFGNNARLWGNLFPVHFRMNHCRESLQRRWFACRDFILGIWRHLLNSLLDTAIDSHRFKIDSIISHRQISTLCWIPDPCQEITWIWIISFSRISLVIRQYVSNPPTIEIIYWRLLLEWKHA